MAHQRGGFEVRGGMALAFALLLAGCASPTVVESVQSADNGRDCKQLQQELSEAEKFRGAAAHEKEVTGGTLIKGLIFFPAVFVSNDNANKAIDAAEARKVHLAGVMNAKKCEAPAKTDTPAPGKK